MAIHETAIIDPSAEIGEGNEIGPYCVIGPDVNLGKNNQLHNHVSLQGPSVIGDNNQFFPSSAVGTAPQDLKYDGEKTSLTVGSNNIFRESVTVNRGTVGGGGATTVGSNCLFMAYSHVAHDCVVEDFVIMANCATLAGHVSVGRNAVVGGLTPVHQFVKIGPYSFIGGATRVSKDITPYIKMGGIPPVVLGANSIGLKRSGFDEEAVSGIEKAVKILFRSKLNSTQAIQRIREEMEVSDSIQVLVDFVENSERGILR